jgi:hypothetical protein
MRIKKTPPHGIGKSHPTASKVAFNGLTSTAPRRTPSSSKAHDFISSILWSCLTTEYTKGRAFIEPDKYDEVIKQKSHNTQIQFSGHVMLTVV